MPQDDKNEEPIKGDDIDLVLDDFNRFSIIFNTRVQDE